MFATFTQKLVLGIYIFILLSIPLGAYLVSEYRTVIKSSASDSKTAKKIAPVTPKPIPPAQELLDSARTTAITNLSTSPSPSPSPSSPTIATSYGPTLSLKAKLESRPEGNQTTRLFVGIAEGVLTGNPKFLLSFTVDLPASGEYANLSLAGLNPGTAYTALLKGSAQIAGSQTFTMSPTVTNLNNGQPVNLTSGDLNEDNVVNAADYSIVQKATGSIPNSSGWNENADLNKDGVINVFDLAIVTKNMGQTGASGAWTSPVPGIATPSAGLTNPPAGAPSGESGHWIWVPNL